MFISEVQWIIDNIYQREKYIFKITQETRDTAREYILGQMYIIIFILKQIQ